MDDARLNLIRELAEASAGPCGTASDGHRNYIVGPDGNFLFRDVNCDLESLIFHTQAKEVALELCSEIDRLKDVVSLLNGTIGNAKL